MRLLVRDVIAVPHDKCSRRDAVSLSWPSDYIERAIDLAEPGQLSLILLHSHPGGFAEFSPVDDRSDQEIIPAIFQACGSLHGSAVMLPNGVIFARIYTPNMKMMDVDLVSVVGPDLSFWWNDARSPSSLRDSCLPSWAEPKRERSESWPVRLAVEAWPPGLE